MARLVLCTVVIALKLLSATSEDIIASCPNLMRVGNIETVFVSLHDRNEPVDVTVKLTLFENGHDGLINETWTSIGPDGGLAYLHVNPDRIPSVETEEVRQNYAFVTVLCPQFNFQETKQVFLSYEEGYVFIQTDKPIYTPNQSVRIRVISLNQTLNPSSKEIRVDIFTPQDVIVQTTFFEEVRDGIIQYQFNFDQEPTFGHWKIVASYGKDLILNRSVEFEVKDYVLPTFSVKIEPPKYILQRDVEIPISITARYVYGKPVRGRLFLKVGVQEEGEEPEFLFNVGRVFNGEEIIVVDVNDLGENWFEENLGSSLYIEATVVEDATGHFENASDFLAKLVESPFIFTWKRMVRYFKKGLPYELKTDLKFVNGKFAPDIPVRVTAVASIDGEPDRLLRGADRVQRGQNGNQQNVPGEQEPMQLNTNEKGQVNFRLYVPGQCTNIHVVVETVLPELRQDDNIDNNARLEVDIHPFESPAENEFLVLRSGGGSMRPDRDDLVVEVFLNSVTQRPFLHYFVISRGNIMQFGKKYVASVDGIVIPISYEMVPSARIVGYYISDSGQIISDSIWVEIERECDNRLRVSVLTLPDKRYLNENEPILPQSQIFLRVTGAPGTSVALLAVDQAVLLLRDYHRLTPDKMYGTMDEHDIGCGPGGGRNTANVFLNAGLVVISTNSHLDVPHREGPICIAENSRRRRRRSVTSLISVQDMEHAENFACGREERGITGATCEEKARNFRKIARPQLPTLIRNFMGFSKSQKRALMMELNEMFLECCMAGPPHGTDLTDPRYITTRLSDVQIRNDFRESWAFDVIKIPEDHAGPVEQVYSVPGSITTWSIQAFGLHSEKAMCIPEEVNLIVFQGLFIQLDLPYSVVRKERVEIQATVFNYGPETLAAQMFLMVPEEVCSDSIPGEFSAQKDFEVEGYGAVTITYMLVGLQTGEFPIKVAALTTGMSDIVEKRLNVLAEVTYNDPQRIDGGCPFNLEVTNQRVDEPDGTTFHKDDRVRIRVCATYLRDQRTGTAVIDVGLYSGFTPVSESLKNLVGGGSPIDRTEISGRSVIFYVDHIPSQEEPPLCFQFDAKCEIVVGNLHHASVHVYDYFNPGEECKVFYAPPGEYMLQPLCNSDGECSCVSGECAACSGPEGETADHLLDIACATVDTYVYKIEVTNIDNQGGFKIITGMVEQVIKRGEDQDAFENFQLQFWVSSSCDCPGFRRGRKYMVIGRNTLRYEEQEGEIRYKYIIDNTATVRIWKKGRQYAYLNQVNERIESGQSNCG